jgi:hypothetical protein
VSRYRKSARVVTVRDSKDPDGPKLLISPANWQMFLGRLTGDELLGLPTERPLSSRRRLAVPEILSTLGFCDCLGQDRVLRVCDPAVLVCLSYIVK